MQVSACIKSKNILLSFITSDTNKGGSMVNKRLKAARLEAGLTLLEVSKILKVSEATVQRYESGSIKNVKHETIQAMSKLYKKSPAFLMGWEDDSTLNEEASEISNIAAHVDGDPLTEEEQEEVINFIKFIKSKRKDHNTK